MAFVLDASVALAWCFPDEATTAVESVLAAVQTRGAVVPGVWPFEIANALLMGERRRRLAPIDLLRAVSLLESLSIRLESCDLRLTLGVLRLIAQEQNLSVYDAAYLELAMRQGLPLATLDGRLREAATRVGVPLMQ